MWLSINNLSMDQGNKKQSVSQDRELPDNVKFEKNDTNLQFYHINFS